MSLWFCEQCNSITGPMPPCPTCGGEVSRISKIDLPIEQILDFSEIDLIQPENYPWPFSSEKKEDGNRT